MTKGEAFYYWRLDKMGIFVSIADRSEAAFMIKHFGFQTCKDAYYNKHNDSNSDIDSAIEFVHSIIVDDNDIII